MQVAQKALCTSSASHLKQYICWFRDLLLKKKKSKNLEFQWDTQI